MKTLSIYRLSKVAVFIHYTITLTVSSMESNSLARSSAPDSLSRGMVSHLMGAKNTSGGTPCLYIT